MTSASSSNSQGFPSQTPAFCPVGIQEVEIAEPLPAVSAVESATGKGLRRVLSLVRLHGRPLGTVDLVLDESGITAADYAREIWRVLGARIVDHLRRDGLPEISELEADGVSSAAHPKCLQECAALLSDAPFVSVVVATRDRPDSLRRCVESLLSLDYPDYEIIVVDSAPATKATAEMLRQEFREQKQVRYLYESVPGLAVAHNRGLMAVDSPIVAFTDDDVIVDPRWLIHLVKGFGVSGNVGCVTGLILPSELQTPAQAWIEQYGHFNKGFSQRIFDLEENRPDDPLYPFSAGTFGSGANMAFKTAALREIGGFDPALGAGSGGCGGDDLAAFFDVVTSGYAIVYEPSAIIWHRHRREYAGLRKLMYGYGVGLTAYLTKTLIDRPRHILDLAARMPHGLMYAINPRSEKNRRRPTGYPRELISIERKGMLHGPFAYLASRWRSRKIRPRFDFLDSPH